uniref:Sulfotransferase domain-containing protein n=1 Tax=Mucochytrium quahogii TaxID=96639 RepID=A0A7S2RMJ4_9STRA|mmetsp:Transcript_17391/g.38003  ORF Transcript_17391/g.38003 Transcript_17391/m.38003 type:complete len:326 (+) Transcript_17391:216-1193(+)|eukprot:CAMPEP_0203751246 /NCGR_PEP_ID=MMETSP0098-20131031/5346_1 /ASSEMBLY_ACC=CAM_ASM_000208 /TAXON_ID=96639 /ORGANISM=" , Strain NY0313808BC1" /LENGTH=325 /DNA_ID=CAMNT_0050640873 /DNA_START=24 /DNA_END=1001 /DNA_ORIENTATION=+
MDMLNKDMAYIHGDPGQLNELGHGKMERNGSRSWSDESKKRGFAFVPRPTDVIIATAPKTGTTLLQWVCHTLRSNCDVDFEDLYQVSPWISCAWDMGLSLEESRFFPRLYKSHLRLKFINRGCKYIVTIRDPAKTAISFYNFMLAKKAPPVLEMDSVSDFICDDNYFKEDMRFEGSLWEYYVDFYKARENPNVLCLVFEDLVTDMKGHLELIADFIGVETTPDLIDRVSELSTKTAMAKHMHKLDETWSTKRLKELNRMNNAGSFRPAARVVEKKHNNVINKAAEQVLNEKWEQIMVPATGAKNYAEFQNMIRKGVDRRRNAIKR